MLRQSSSFFLLVLALLACTVAAFVRIAAPVAPRHVLFATKAETVRVYGEIRCRGSEGVGCPSGRRVVSIEGNFYLALRCAAILSSGNIRIFYIYSP